MSKKNIRSKLAFAAPAVIAGAVFLSAQPAQAATPVAAKGAIKVLDKAFGFGFDSVLSAVFGIGAYEMSEETLAQIAATMSDIVDSAFYADYMTTLEDATDADAGYSCTSDLPWTTCISRAQDVLDKVQTSANDWENAVGLEGTAQFMLMTSMEISYMDELIKLNEAAGYYAQAEAQKQALGAIADNARSHMDDMELDLEDLVYGLGYISLNSTTQLSSSCTGWGLSVAGGGSSEPRSVCITGLDGELRCNDVTVVTGSPGTTTVAVFDEISTFNDQVECNSQYDDVADYVDQVMHPEYLEEMHEEIFGGQEYDVFLNTLEWYAEYDSANFEYVGNHDWKPIHKGQADVTTSWTTINYDGGLLNPVVIAGPASFNGTHPVTVQTRNADSNSFEIRLQEFEYQDGNHSTEQVSWMVIEGGMTHFDDYGNTWYAGKTVTEGTSTASSNYVEMPEDVNNSSAQVFLTPQTGTSTAVVIDTSSWPPVVVTEDDTPAHFRVDNLDATQGFDIIRQEEQALLGTSEGFWEVGYLIVGDANGISNPNSKMLLKGDDLYYSTMVRTDENWDEVRVDVFDPDASTATQDVYNETLIGEITYQEETSADDEVGHSHERVDILVTHDDNGNELLFAQDYTFNGSDPGNIRWQ